MDEKTKDIAIVSIEQWMEIYERVSDAQAELLARITNTCQDPVIKSIIVSSACLIFGKTVSSIRKELFPDAEFYEEEGELKWK